MSLTTADEIYEQVIKPLPAEERERLAKLISQSLSGLQDQSERVDWMSVRGIAPNLLGGEDAQAWVTRGRQEWDDREKQWSRDS